MEEYLEEMAQQVAVALGGLSPLNAVRVELTPGDATCYRITIVAPGPILRSEGMGSDYPAMGVDHEFLVVLANNFGKAYPWNPEGWLSDEYAGEKWARSSHQAVGRVMADFLNALASKLGYQ